MTRRLIPFAFLALTASGCTLLNRAEPLPVAPPALEAAPASPVKAEEINAANARDKARQLHEELDRALSGE